MNSDRISDLIQKKGLLLKVFASLLLLAFLLVEASTPVDFEIFLNASSDLLAHKDIYKVKYNLWYHYYYDVSFALLLSPFLLLPIYVANFIWLLLNVFFTYRIWKLIKGYIPFEKARSINRFETIFNWVVVLSIFSLWHRNMHLSQMTILLLYICLEAIELIKLKKVWQGSLLLAFGISVKIMPVVLLPYLFFRGQFKAFALVLVLLASILMLPSLIVGVDYNTELLKSRWELINPTNKEHVIDLTEESFHSLSSFLPALLIEDAGAKKTVDLKRNVANVSYETMSLILNIIRGVLIVLFLFVLRPGFFKSFGDNLQVLFELSYLMLVTPLIFPHQQHYAFFMVLPAIAYLVYFYLMLMKNNLIIGSKRFAVLVLFGLIFILLNSHFLVGAYRDYYDYFKTLTYGIILLIPLLLMSRPVQLVKRQQNSTK